MGMSPSSGEVRFPTQLEWAKAEYVRGNLSIEQFEKRVEILLKNGWEDNIAPPPHPRSGMRVYEATEDGDVRRIR